MKIWLDDPKQGRIFFDVDEDRIVSFCWNRIVLTLLKDNVTMGKIWGKLKAKLEAEYVMTPREDPPQ